MTRTPSTSSPQRAPARAARLRALATALGLALAAAAPAARAEDHVVKKGETLGGIAHHYHCTIAAIKAANGLKRDGIRAGQKLTVPDDCATAAAGASDFGEPTSVDPPTPNAKGGDKKAIDGKGKGKATTLTHEVLADETLDDLASRYDTTVEAIQAKNKGKLKKGIRPGLKLQIVTTSPDRAQKRETYVIQAGDNFGRIAKRFGITTRDLQRMNPGKNPERLKIGQKLVIIGEGRPGKSQAVGRPQAGRLVDGEQLRPGPGWTLRGSDHAWGTNETVRMLKAAFTEVRKKHPGAHDICVGDLSAKNGGFLAPHKSHQSGLDADIGFYFRRAPSEHPCVFNNASLGLDYEAMWTLINALAGPSESASKVEYMFLGYDVQKQLYDWAKKKGVPEAKLEWLFQYPRGSAAMVGLIRHEPSHTNHIHIRYECPNGDKQCL